MQATFSTLFLKTSLFSSLQELLELHYYWSIHFDQFRMYLLYWLITSSLKKTNINFKIKIYSLTFEISLSDSSCKECTGKGIGNSSDSKIKPVVKFSGLAEENNNNSLKRIYHVLFFTAEKIKNKKMNYKEYAMLICLIC